MARAAMDKMPFMEHLGELRVRIVRALIALLIGLGAALPFSQQIMDYLSRPIKQSGHTLVFLSLTEAFWVQMKVAIIVGLFVAAPGILWQVWAFVAPGLYEQERKYALPFVLIGSLMFIGGGVFALKVVTPFATQFLLSYARPGLTPMISIESYIDFLLKFTLAFGVVFELPLAITLLSRLGVVTPKMLAKNRKYAILGAFVVSAVITPTPDAFNQALMAGPLIILYEIGIVCARIFGKRRAGRDPAGGGELMDFHSFDLPEPVMQGIQEAGFVTATPIQEAALPLALKGKDVAGQSQTGTGKTAAFLIAGFTRMLANPAPASSTSAPRMLVIAPTRELVVQIEADARLLGRFTPFKVQAVYGGIDYNKQREDLASGCDVLVGTPGRLIDYLKQHVWSPRRVEMLVIDEADRMFDMGFIADLRFILRRLPAPEKRQSCLFSATLSFRVLELTWEFMNNPAQITIMPNQKTAERVEQTLYHVGREEKFPLLLGLLRREGGDRVLIFSNTREEARRLEERLSRNGFEARALTGDVDQRKRLRILNDFKEGRLPVLVASDVASRGLHIDAVSHVFNWDLPQDPEDYVHRIGRTARAGAEGKAMSLVDESSALAIEAIEKFIGHKIEVGWADDDLFAKEIPPTAEERRRYADERRARMAARRGGGDRGRRPGGDRRGGPSSGPRRSGDRPTSSMSRPVDTPGSVDGQSPPRPESPGPRAGGDATRPRRRRGGRRGAPPPPPTP